MTFLRTALVFAHYVLLQPPVLRCNSLGSCNDVRIDVLSPGWTSWRGLTCYMAKAALPVVCGRIVAAGEKHGQNLQALSLSLSLIS